jgi:hypothetical protein
VRCDRPARGRTPSLQGAVAPSRPGSTFTVPQRSADPELLSAILAGLDGEDRRRARRRRAVVVAAAGAVVIARRRTRGAR